MRSGLGGHRRHAADFPAAGTGRPDAAPATARVVLRTILVMSEPGSFPGQGQQRFAFGPAEALVQVFMQEKQHNGENQTEADDDGERCR